MKTIKLDNNIEEVIDLACQVLAGGGLVVYPTETCYGLGVDVSNSRAVAKLLSYKRRREGKPLSVLVSDQKMAEKYVELNQSARNFYNRFLPGPVTVVSKSKAKVVREVESEMGTLGIRISSHKLAMEMVKKYGKAITATSANPSYKRKPYNIEVLCSTLSEKQKEKLDLIIDAGILPKNESSTVVDTTLLGDMVLRKGAINLGKDRFETISKNEEETKKIAETLVLKYWNSLRKKGLVLALFGDLGVGKTVFAKGVGKYLKIAEEIVSPSYNLANEYEWKRNEVSGKFYHLDPWRMASFADFLKIGFEEMLEGNNLVLIEWASKYEKEIEEDCKKRKVKLVKVFIEEIEERERKIEVAG